MIMLHASQVANATTIAQAMAWSRSTAAVIPPPPPTAAPDTFSLEPGGASDLHWSLEELLYELCRFA
jgi:hypothetical protein